MVWGPRWPHGLGVQSGSGCKKTFQKRKELSPQRSLGGWCLHSLPQSHHDPGLPLESLSTRVEMGLTGTQSRG